MLDRIGANACIVQTTNNSKNDVFPAPDRLSITAVQQAVAEHFGMTVHDLISDRRTHEESLARHIGMYLAQELTTRSHQVIARCFGRADHTMSIYARKKIQRLIAMQESPVALRIEQIKFKLAGETT